MINLRREDLEREGLGGSVEFQGYQYGGVGVSFIWVDVEPGGGPRLHQHPYAETFIVLEGQATFTVGAATVQAGPGQVLVAAANTPHKFINSGSGPLRQIDIHASDRFITEWLED
jgi:mannose-6-phosphate isomerase-like protein (cupin superfamily)